MGSFTETILGTIKGANNEGSSKRITAAYFTIVILSALTAAYTYGYYLACIADKPTNVHVLIVAMYIYVISAYLLSIIATVRGNNPETKPKADA